MRMKKNRVLCIMAAVFLLLIGAPFFSFQTELMVDQVDSAMENAFNTGHFDDRDVNLLSEGEQVVQGAVTNPLMQLSMARTQRQYAGFSMSVMIYMAFGLLFLILNEKKSFEEYYIFHDILSYYMAELKVVQRCDGKCRLSLFIA